MHGVEVKHLRKRLKTAELFSISILYFHSMEEKEKYAIKDKSRNNSLSKEAETLNFTSSPYEY
jgi:hypothetical protein